MSAKIISLFLYLFLFIFVTPVTDARPLFSPNSGETKVSIGERINILLERMSPEEKIGQLFMVAGDGNLGELIHSYHLGGVVLFSRHTETIEQTLQMTQKIRRSSLIQPLIAIDQEGGRISRLSFATPVPSARALGHLDETALLLIGWIVGQELHELGFNLNFAPVLDVDTCDENPVIGSRSFSSDPHIVATLGTAYLRGLRSAGVAGTVKHFPGHGDTSTDSHLTLPVVNQSRDRLNSVELLPFTAATRSGAEVVMMAHVHYPALDPTKNLPASLSGPIITGILRKEMNYDGIIITDAMNMKAITDFTNSGQAALMAFQAGNDIILMPENLQEAYFSLLLAVRNGTITETRLNESVRRILRLKLTLPADTETPFDLLLSRANSSIGSHEHRLGLDSLMKGKLSPVESPTQARSKKGLFPDTESGIP